jgi:hypothetical protein
MLLLSPVKDYEIKNIIKSLLLLFNILLILEIFKEAGACAKCLNFQCYPAHIPIRHFPLQYKEGGLWEIVLR